MLYKEWEIFSEIRVPPGFTFFIRSDGRRFRRVVGVLDAMRPYDIKIAKCMVSTVLSLPKEGFVPLMAYIVSDEINMLFNEVPYGGRVEKIISVLSGVLSSTLSREFYRRFAKNVVVSFDSRIVFLPRELIANYIISRQKIGWNNCLVSHAAHVLREKGLSPKEIGKTLNSMKQPALHELLMKEGGINPSKLPEWQKNGILIFRENSEYVTLWNTPVFTSSSGNQLLQKILSRYF